MRQTFFEDIKLRIFILGEDNCVYIYRIIHNVNKYTTIAKLIIFSIEKGTFKYDIRLS